MNSFAEIIMTLSLQKYIKLIIVKELLQKSLIVVIHLVHTAHVMGLYLTYGGQGRSLVHLLVAT